MDFLQEFLSYFFNPLETLYTVPKTLAYSAVLILAVLIIYKIFNRFGIKIDRKFVVGISPFAAFGVLARLMYDFGVTNSPWFFTPGVWLLATVVASVSLFFALLVEKRFKVDYYKVLFLIGLILSSFLASFITAVNIQTLLLFLTIYLPWLVILQVIRLSLTNKIVAMTQMLDATVTYIGLTFFTHGELDVIPRLFIGFLSPGSFLFLKFFAVIGFVLVIDKFSKDKNFNNYLKLIISIIGGGTGLRDLLKLLTFT